MFHMKHGRASIRVDMVSFLKLALNGFIPDCAYSLDTYVESSRYRRGVVLMAKLEQGPSRCTVASTHLPLLVNT